MKILLTNDDGFDALGLRALYDALSPEHNVIVCAPSTQQSGTAHRLTLDRPLRARRLQNGMKGWVVDGTPADCVKLALRNLIDSPVDLVISGINQGSNAGLLVHYSGTVAGAKEAATMGLPAVAISLCGYKNLNYQPTAERLREMIAKIDWESFPKMTLLNVNVPNIPPEEIAGVRVVPMSVSVLTDGYECREDPRGLKYYWLSAKLAFDPSERIDDHEILRKGYIAVCPLSLDWTHNAAVTQLSHLEAES